MTGRDRTVLIVVVVAAILGGHLTVRIWNA